MPRSFLVKSSGRRQSGTSQRSLSKACYVEVDTRPTVLTSVADYVAPIPLVPQPFTVNYWQDYMKDLSGLYNRIETRSDGESDNDSFLNSPGSVSAASDYSSGSIDCSSPSLDYGSGSVECGSASVDCGSGCNGEEPCRAKERVHELESHQWGLSSTHEDMVCEQEEATRHTDSAQWGLVQEGGHSAEAAVAGVTEEHEWVEGQNRPEHSLTDASDASVSLDSIAITDGRSKKKSEKRLEVGESQNSRPRYTCSECGKHYATSSNLSRHKQTHRSLDSKQAKKCPHCHKVYVSMPALSMHILTHNLKHSCHVCGKTFSRPWLLQGHLRSHSGEKPYGCAHCGKAFADRSNLRAHMQTHSALKHFTCKRCDKSFALKSYLNKHYESSCLKP